MKIKSIALAVAAIMILAGGLLAVNADKPQQGGEYNGNGAPSGAHYNINIIGVPDQAERTGFNGGNGARIFVDRTGATKFYVNGSDHFEICDHDGTDGEVGTGPNPNAATYEPGILLPYDNGEWQCQIYVRLVGPKDSSCHWKSEYFDGSYWVEIANFSLYKNSKFQCQTGKLLDNQYQDILWTLDEKYNFRNCQMRIYLTET